MNCSFRKIYERLLLSFFCDIESVASEKKNKDRQTITLLSIKFQLINEIGVKNHKNENN